MQTSLDLLIEDSMFVHYYLMVMIEQDWKIFVDTAMLMLFDVDVQVMNVVMVVEHNQLH